MRSINTPFTHLILGGGGLSGLTYIGIYRFIKEHGMMEHIRYVSGTSIGALFAFLIGLNVDYEYMETFFIEHFAEKNQMTEFDPKSILHFRTNQGMYSAERFRKYIVQFLRTIDPTLEDITFTDYLKLTGVDIHIHVTSLNTYSPLDLSNNTHPEMSVVTAVLASMSIPLMFEPVIYKDLVLVDGGCCANLQIYEIAKNKLNKILYVALGIDTVFTTESLKTNTLLYGASVMMTLVTSHTKKIIEDYKEVIDIIHITKNPIPFVQFKFSNNLFYTMIEKEQLEESIIYGYQQIYESCFTDSS